MGRRRTEAGVEEYVNLEERLRPYLDASTDDQSQRHPERTRAITVVVGSAPTEEERP